MAQRRLEASLAQGPLILMEKPVTTFHECFNIDGRKVIHHDAHPLFFGDEMIVLHAHCDKDGETGGQIDAALHRRAVSLSR